MSFASFPTILRPIFRTERAVRQLVLAVPLTLLFFLALVWPLMGLFEELTENGRPPGVSRYALDGLGDLSVFLLVPVMQALFLVVPFLSVRTRVHELERALPVSMRSLVWTRIAATWAALVVPLATGGLVLYLRLREDPAGSLALAALGCATAGVTLGVLLAFAWRPRAVRLGTLEVFVLALVGLGLVVLPGFVDEPRLGLAYLVPIAALAAYLHRALPSATTGDGVGRARTTTSSRGVPLGDPLRWTLLRSTVLRPTSLGSLLFLAACIPVLGRENLAFFLVFPFLIPIQVAHQGLAVRNGLDPLPLPRARLLPWVVLPSLAALLVGFGLWNVVPRDYRSFEALALEVELDTHSVETLGTDGDYGLHVRVPAALWRVAGEPEAVTSPWGESVRPLAHPVLWGASTSIVNPYDVTGESTVRFLCWQLSRALAEAYGVDLTPEEVHARWFAEVEPEAAVGDVKKALLEGFPSGGLDTDHRLQPNATFLRLLAAVLVWTLALGFALRRNVPPATRRAWVAARVRRGVALGLVVLLLLAIVALTMMDSALLPVLAASAYRGMDAALGSSPALWIALDLALAAAGYAFLRARLQRMEVAPPPRYGWHKRELSVY